MGSDTTAWNVALDQLDENGEQRLSVDEWVRSGPRWESLEAE